MEYRFKLSHGIILLLFVFSVSSARASHGDLLLPAAPTLTADTLRQGAQPARQEKGQEKTRAAVNKPDILKVIPKARNQQVPRPVSPNVQVKVPNVKVKTKIITKVKLKL